MLCSVIHDSFFFLFISTIFYGLLGIVKDLELLGILFYIPMKLFCKTDYYGVAPLIPQLWRVGTTMITMYVVEKWERRRSRVVPAL